MRITAFRGMHQALGHPAMEGIRITYSFANLEVRSRRFLSSQESASMQIAGRTNQL
jgi:hypothetical protein